MPFTCIPKKMRGSKKPHLYFEEGQWRATTNGCNVGLWEQVIRMIEPANKRIFEMQLTAQEKP